MWKIRGRLELKDMVYNFYLIHGLEEQDSVKILAAKPWRLGDYPILVRTWKPSFIVEMEAATRVIAIWVSIFALPVEYHTPETLINLGNLLGKTVALDALNSTQIFQVRISVETDINLTLPNHIVVDHKSFRIKFENLYVFEPTVSSFPPSNRNNHQTLGWTINGPNGFENSNSIVFDHPALIEEDNFINTIKALNTNPILSPKPSDQTLISSPKLHLIKLSVGTGESLKNSEVNAELTLNLSNTSQLKNLPLNENCFKSSQINQPDLNIIQVSSPKNFNLSLSPNSISLLPDHAIKTVNQVPITKPSSSNNYINPLVIEIDNNMSFSPQDQKKHPYKC